MLDVEKCKEILEHHFETVTREEFLANLEKFCPEFSAAEIEDSAVERDNIDDSCLIVSPILVRGSGAFACAIASLEENQYQQ